MDYKSNKKNQHIQTTKETNNKSNSSQFLYLLKNFIVDDNEKNQDVPDRQTMRNVYGNDFEDIAILLKLEEDSSKQYFHDIMNGLEERYQQFNLNMKNHFVELTNKITESFKIDNNISDKKDLGLQNVNSGIVAQKYSKEYLERIKKIINMHKQIFDCIKETISILFNFLDISKSLEKEKPIQEFLGKEFNNIIKSWLFLKLDIEKFDFAKALNDSELDSNFKNFILKVCQGKNFVMNISSPKQYLLDENLSSKVREELMTEKIKNKNILRDNCNNLVKLKMTNTIDADTYLEDIPSFDNMKSLKIKRVSFKNNNENFLKNCPKLEKLYINSSKNFELKILQNLSKHLTKLSLENNGIVNFEFNNIINNYLKKSNSIRNNLEYLSFANNNLSYIDFTQIITNQKSSFLALKNLNFRKNQIYKFHIPFEYFSELKSINCCYNSFTKDNFSSNQNILVLQGGNSFLSNINFAKKYFNDLGKKLNTYQINLIYLNLSYIPFIFSNDYLSNIKINDTILLGLKKIDLSYNGMTNIIFFNFIDNNKGILNLKTLNLNGNKLDDLFFEIYLNLKLNNKFTKLSKLHLDSNLFGDDNIEVTYNPEDGKNINNKINKLRLLYRFIDENKVLAKMSIIKNIIFNDFKLLDFYKNSENYFKKDNKGNIIINCLNSFLYKIKTELLIKNEKNNSRNSFNLKFDCQSDINQNSEDVTYQYE